MPYLVSVLVVGVGIGAMDLESGIFAENGELAARWQVWGAVALACYGAILLLVYVHHYLVADFNAPPLSWRVGYGLAFALFSGAMAFAEPGFFLCFAKLPLRLLDAMRPQAYGIFLVHYVFIIWLQYAVLPCRSRPSSSFRSCSPARSREAGRGDAVTENSVHRPDDLMRPLLVMAGTSPAMTSS